MALLVQFLLRLCFGLAAGMAITSSKLVTSGYYRNHLYVTLGLSALAAMFSRSVSPESFWWALAAAVLSYVGAVCWLYEKHRAGVICLVLVAISACGGAVFQSDATHASEVPSEAITTDSTTSDQSIQSQRIKPDSAVEKVG